MWSDLRADRAHGELTILRTQQKLAIITTIIVTIVFTVENLRVHMSKIKTAQSLF